MNIIGREILQKYWEEKRETENSLKTWIQVIEQNDWKHIFDLKQTFRFADAVGTCTAFNIKGNHYRLITKINFQTQTVRVLYVLTHAQYDERGWKRNDCDCRE
ncbi:MAG: type II toxin-antitoxin system HigB family toxin [Acidobacteriota bacterium]|nr:type II toxin-antitoxin system HigB family toxin [Acidobacteriota bacterium]